MIYYKPNLTETNTHVLAAASGGWTVANSFRINDLATIIANFGGYFPGMDILTHTYSEYRVYGVKLSMTLWPRVTPISSASGVTATGLALIVFFEASPVSTFATDNGATPSLKVENMMQGRFRRYKIINYSTMGAKPTKISWYFNVHNIFGGDVQSKTDVAFVGTINTTSGALAGPLEGPYMRWGLASLAGVAPASDIVFDNRITIKPYVKFFRSKVLYN